MLTANFDTRVVVSDDDITDGVAFHAALRALEAGNPGMQYPRIHDYRQISLPGGAVFPAITFVNGWSLTMPSGSSVISGFNLSATINPVAGAFVIITQSAAYAVASGGGGGADASAVASAVWAHAVGASVYARVSEMWTRLGLFPTRFFAKTLKNMQKTLQEEVVYLGADNPIAIELSNNAMVISPADVTRCKLIINKQVGVSADSKQVLDSAVVPQYFDLDDPAALVLKLGNAPLTVGRHVVTIVVYTALSTGGTVFGQIIISVESL